MTFRKLRHQSVSGPEHLESREMLSGNGIVSAARLAAHAAASTASQSQVQRVSSSVAGSTDSDSDSERSGCHGHTSLSGTLSDPANTSATGTVTYTVTKSTSSTGTAVTNFNVSVSGTTANSTLDVAINGVVVGQIATDATGAGSLALSSSPTGTQQALPANFPTTISANAVVTVGTLSTTLASTHTSHTSILTAALTDSAGTATGTAKFKTNTENGHTWLSLSVTGLAASSTLDVSIGGTVVGQITTDSTGAGRVKLKNPSVAATSGSTITVGTLTGTFATSSSSSSSTSSAARAFARWR